MVEFKTMTQTVADRITPALQYSHSNQFLINPPPPQTYGSSLSIYRWEFVVDEVKLFLESQIINQRKR